MFNSDDGGGINPSPELRKKRSENSKRIMNDPEHKRIQSENSKRRYSDPNERRRHSEIMLAVAARPGEYERRSAYLSGVPKSDKWKTKMRVAGKKRFQKKEERKKISIALKKYYSNPESRKKASQIQQSRILTDEARRKMAVRKGIHPTEYTLSKLSQKSSALWQDPEYQLMMYKARHCDLRRLYVEWILHDAYIYYPEAKHFSMSQKVELIHQIANHLSQHDNQPR